MGGEAEELYQRFVDRGGGAQGFLGADQDDRRQLEVARGQTSRTPVTALDRSPLAGPHRPHADRDRTNAQPGDPQIPARPHRDGDGRARFPQCRRRRSQPAGRAPCSPPAWSTASISGATSSRSRPRRRSNGTSSSPKCSALLLDHFMLGAPLFAQGQRGGDRDRRRPADVRGRSRRRRHHRPDQGIDRNPRPPGGGAGRRRHRLSRL